MHALIFYYLNLLELLFFKNYKTYKTLNLQASHDLLFAKSKKRSAQELSRTGSLPLDLGQAAGGVPKRRSLFVAKFSWGFRVLGEFLGGLGFRVGLGFKGLGFRVGLGFSVDGLLALRASGEGVAGFR